MVASKGALVCNPHGGVYALVFHPLDGAQTHPFGQNAPGYPYGSKHWYFTNTPKSVKIIDLLCKRVKFLHFA